MTYNSYGGHGVHGAFGVVDMSFSGLQLPATVALAALAVLGYMVSRARQGRAQLTVLDALIVAGVVIILAAAAIPLIEAASSSARESALLENLHTLRSQIALYKAEHGGEPPLLFEGTFPQLIQPTNAAGEPGPIGSKYPFGPYLRTGVPLNPITGRSVVTLTKSFPATAPSGNGGWLYHQATGQIAADLEEYLTQ